MKKLSRFITLLSLPIALAGCELFTTGAVKGSLEPLSEDQLAYFAAAGSGTPSTNVISSASNIEIDVQSDCTGEFRDVILFPLLARTKPASGTVTIDDKSYTITHATCDSEIVDDIDRAGLFLATPDDESQPSEVSIIFAEFSSAEELSADSEFAPFADKSLLIVSNFTSNNIIPNTFDFTIAAGIFVPEPIQNDAENVGRQVITQAALDLDALITDEHSYTNWILSGALFALERAENEKNWESDNLLTDRKGHRTFANVATAVNEIERIADWTDDGALMASLDSITTSVLDAMRSIASDRIALAVENAGDEFRIARANYRLEDGDVHRSQDYLSHTVRLYGRAWKAATRSMR